MKRAHSLIDSFTDAFIGMSLALREERNMRIHFALAALATLLGLYLGLEPWQWVVILLVIAAVISMELVNSAIERAVDLAEPNDNPLAAFAKRLAASAVLVVAVVAVVIGLIIFVPYLRVKFGI
ncbi:MAG: diacylglycerol kinase family protein [Peptococcaceae bacterium]|nr:diacylglycerol kinase family protein [Peptococcaceae bacterium]